MALQQLTCYSEYDNLDAAILENFIGGLRDGKLQKKIARMDGCDLTKALTVAATGNEERAEEGRRPRNQVAHHTSVDYDTDHSEGKEVLKTHQAKWPRVSCPATGRQILCSLCKLWGPPRAVFLPFPQLHMPHLWGKRPHRQSLPLQVSNQGPH